MDLNVSLPDELARYVEAKVSSGSFASSSEVVQEALRLMESHELNDTDRLQALRDAWRYGVDSGDAGEIDFAAVKAEARARLTTVKS